MRVGILTSHPIQYQAPWFRALAKEVTLQVLFCHEQSAADQARAGFGVEFDWDVDMLSGYEYRFLDNVASRPDVNRFTGCDTPEVREVIAKGEFDAFIVSGWHLKSYWQAVRECRRLGIPVLVRGDSQLATPRSFLKRCGKELLYPWLFRKFDGFMVVGKRNREYLLHYRVPERKIFFVPHFVDNEWFSARAAVAKRRRMEIRKEWNIGEKTFCPLFVGKFIDKKRPADLIRAVALLRKKGIAADCVFVGAGELEKDLRAESAELGVPARFVGFKNQTELPGCYVSADVLVLPSDGGETWGLVVNEAMACGLPAVVSDAVGCAPDLVDEGRTGFNFPLGDIDALCDRLEQMSKLLAHKETMERALASKTAEYSIANSVLGTLQAVTLLSRKSPGFVPRHSFNSPS